DASFSPEKKRVVVSDTAPADSGQVWYKTD
ncbi:hypothetical protein ACR6EC_24410, partial [Bacillus subtilis]